MNKIKNKLNIWLRSLKERFDKILLSIKKQRWYKDGKKFTADKVYRKRAIGELIGASRHTCINCGEELFTDENFCDECSKEIVMLSGDICPKCGRKVIGRTSCNICKTTQHSFDRAFTAFDYDGEIIKYIINMKLNRHAYLYKPLAKYLAHVYLKNSIDVDMVTYIPITKKVKKDRRYNHARLLAREFSYLTGIELFDGVEKIKETEYQKRLNAEDRRKNMKGVFKITEDVKGKRILIIDDVMTTGATIDSLAKELKKKNSSKIFAITLASTGEKFTKD